MARKAGIDKLPPEVRQAIDAKLADPRFTLEQLVTEIGKIVPPGTEGVSQSALQRRQQDISVVGERIRRSKDIADALVGRFGEADDAKLARLNNQVLQTTIMDVLSAADEEGQPITLSPKHLADLSKALNELARAKKTEGDHLLKVRKETAQKAADAVDKIVSKTPGLSKDTVSEIRRAVLGVAE